jgi:outer membrane protein assembly factor BamB
VPDLIEPGMIAHAFGLWPDYRGNDARTGVQPLAAAPRKMRKPLEQRWSLHLGGGFQEVLPVGDGSGDVLMCDAGGVQRLTIDGELRWATKPFGAHGITGVYDLDSDGRLEIITTNGTELLILNAENGKTLWRSSIIAHPLARHAGTFRSYGTYAGMIQAYPFFGEEGNHGCPMQLVVPVFVTSDLLVFDCSRGAAKTKLHTVLKASDAFHPTITIGDVNRDGKAEIVVARLGGVYVYDPESGEKISETLWESDETRRRNYGHFELLDIDGDGDLEAVIIGDRVSRHIAVLDNDGKGNFQPLWDRFIQHIYPTDTTELRYVTNSISSLDTSGKPSIAVSIFNERSDDKWYTEVLDPVSGAQIAEYEDCYLRGIVDANADGVNELCLSYEEARMPATFAPLFVTSLDHGVLWSGGPGAFSEKKIYPSPSRGEFKPDVFHPLDLWHATVGDQSGICIFGSSKGVVDLSLLTPRMNRVSLGTNFEGLPRIAHHDTAGILVSEANGRITRVSKNAQSHWRNCGYHLTTEAHSAARPGIQATVAERGKERYLLVPTFSNEINIYRSLVAGALPQMHATIRGRSRLGYDSTYHAVSTIDVSGEPVAIVVDDVGLDHARVSLYSMDAERIRSFDFPEMPPSRPGTRIGAYEWLAFEHSRGPALMISFFQSQSMNSETSLAVLVDSGEVLWRAERVGEGEYGRGLGPWSAIAKRDNAALLCAKDLLITLDLETGAVIGEPRNLTHFTGDAMRASGIYREQDYSTWSSIEDPFTAYGTPIVVQDRVLLSGCFGGMGLLENDASRWWHVTSFGDVLYKLPGIADFDGDGNLEFGQPHADGSFSVHDLATGSERYRIAIGAIGSDVLAVDCNGDGRDEFVFGTNDGRLIVVGFRHGVAEVLEEHRLPASAGSPIAADLDGDGVSEIYIVSAEGNLTCFSHS